MGSAVKSKEAVEVTWIAFQDLESWRTGLNTLNTLAITMFTIGLEV